VKIKSSRYEREKKKRPLNRLVLVSPLPKVPSLLHHNRSVAVGAISSHVSVAVEERIPLGSGGATSGMTTPANEQRGEELGYQRSQHHPKRIA